MLSPSAAAANNAMGKWITRMWNLPTQPNTPFSRDGASGGDDDTVRLAVIGRAAVLPNDGGMNGLAGLAIPQQRGFPLVGDPDCVNVR